jgi:hypothetical protein
MAWFGKKEKGIESSRLHNFLSAAFQKVKHDTTTLFSWIHYFNSKHQQHDQRLEDIERQLYYMPKTREEIKHIVDSHYSLEPIKNRIAELRERIENIEKVRHIEPPKERIIETHPGLQKSERYLRGPVEIIRERAPKAQIREKLVRKIVKNSKEYLKSVILAIIRRYGQISASRLKEMIVEEQGLCSKSSFYRLLSELEKEQDFGVITKGKEKVFLIKSESYINK